MTDKEKLQKALEALRQLGIGGYIGESPPNNYAAQVYAELTAQRVETVEVKRWMCSVCNAMVGQDTVKRGYCPNDNGPLVELTGIYSRPIEEKEEVLTLIVKGNYSNNRGVVFLPKEWSGEEVEIRRLKGE